MDTKTRAVRRVSLKGITDSTARALLQDEASEKGLKASKPVPYLVNNVPAYVASLADADGIPRAYGLVAVKDAQVSAIAGNLNDAVQLFSSRAAIDRPHLALTAY